ncbi:DoxX family protein [Rubrivirga sp. S365]|uniref:DoxX family protein n=1 Tax=Rubrivirga sp. S365 TaxID=3076080 RepID=UPI0028C7BD7C|nr:DoxX family protein [Rubrivirga sp. S365]MDT7858397.1 DoxX family protein [Rubrivirga sp. S365]
MTVLSRSASALHVLIGATPREASADAALLVLRVVTGLSLALGHGLGKVPPSPGFVETVGALGFPAPELFAWGATAAELGGGLLLALGLLTRPAATLVAGTMAVVTLAANAGKAFGDLELGLLYGVIALVFAVLGAGRYSLDAALRRRIATSPVTGQP